MSDSAEKPDISIECCRDGPYFVEGLSHITGTSGEAITLSGGRGLCRCGSSGDKPFCDSSHIDVSFDDSVAPGYLHRRVREYEGPEVTIRDDRKICCHDESCLRVLPEVFDRSKNPWIYPDRASKDQIIAAIELCPSGALSYKIDGVIFDSLDREPGITLVEGGPMKVQGGITLEDPNGNRPTSPEHYALCRCGRSKDKPFCDGSHASS